MGVQARSLHYFVATAGSSVIAFATLPLTTRILGPPNYGQFALGVIVAGVGATLATLGSTYVVNARLPNASRRDATATVSTLVGNALVVSIAWVLLASAAFAVAGERWSALAEIGGTSFAFAVVTTVLLPAWVVTSDVLTLQGRSALYALIATSQGVVTAATTLLCLFAFDLGGVSLFVGYFTGGLAAFVGSMLVLRPYLSLRAPRIPRGELAQGRFLVAQVLDSVHALAERTLLTVSVGFDRLGLYTHSQAYRTYAFQATKAVARGAWPVTLREAADPSSRFEHTRRVWNAVHVGVTAVGTAMALLGYLLVGWLTNGKFVEAALFFAPWFVLILIQNLARPEMATIYAFASAREVARLSVWSNATAIAVAIVLIPPYGPSGAVAALLAQALVFRTLVRAVARRYRKIPFQDGWALLGMAVLTVAFVAERYYDPALRERLLFCVALELLLLAIAFPVVRDVARSLRWPTRPSFASSEP